MTGNMIGYGIPNAGGLGIIGGAWNSASGYLGVKEHLTGISSNLFMTSLAGRKRSEAGWVNTSV